VTESNDAIRALRDALHISPDNIPLRQHLADTLLSYGRLDEAEQEYRAGLARAPQNQPLQIGLAKALTQQGKNDPALRVVQDIIRNSLEIIPAQVYLLHARLLLRAGALERARSEYEKAVDADPAAADAALAEQLGLPAQGSFSSAGAKFHPENEDDVLDSRIALLADGSFSQTETDLERPTITFAHVGGMDKLKEEIRLKIIHPLTHPEIYKAYGKAIGGGILMYGPPGCGKTYLARATAGEVKANFITVGINDILDMWLGNSERNLHEIFERARRNRPCVLFFDEVDALGASRTDMRQSSGRPIINQFLAELDGVKASNDGVLILAATNAPWHLDTAFRRPGRFDRVIFVPPPDAPARAAILRLLLKDKPLRDVDYDHLARKTNDFSGADLKAVIDVAVEGKLQEAIKKGTPTPLTTDDLQRAAKSLKPTTKEWFATARNYALYANQSGLYDEILDHLGLK
jgi:AAA+ superfamily predicted ATPase